MRRLNADINKLLADPQFADRHLLSLGVSPRGGTPQEFADFLKSDRLVASELVKIAKLRLE